MRAHARKIARFSLTTMADRRRPQIIYMTCKKINTVSWDISDIMFTVWTLCLITVAFSQDMETTTPASPNVTFLFPTNKTLIRNLTNSKSLQNPTSQKWKLEAIFSESNFTDKEVNNRSESIKEKEIKEIEEDLNEFKPSVHLGSFFDEDDAEVINTPIAAPVYKKPPRGFVSSAKDEYHPTFNQIEKEIQETHNDLPYKFDNAIFGNDKPNCCSESIDSKPTVEAPTKIPAGVLYKSPDPFKENPTSDEKFDLDIIDDVKEVAVKKRVNPWKNVLRLVTAFIPVGLIISALTPSIINIHNVDDKRNRAGVVRRSGSSDSTMSNLSPISEQCRRRLLCEIHSDRYYVSEPSKSYRSKKHCYKLHCEDTEALWKMLRWLFTYNRPEENGTQKYLT